MAHVKNQTVHSGHTIKIKAKGKVVGRAQGIDGDRSFGTEGVYEIGSIMPQEHIHNRYEGSLTMERFFVRTEDLTELGLASLGEEVLKRNIFTFEIEDNYTGKLVRSYHGVSIVNYRENFRVGAIAGENATFTYLFARDGKNDDIDPVSRTIIGSEGDPLTQVYNPEKKEWESARNLNTPKDDPISY